jgi:hypothetical protein
MATYYEYAQQSAKDQINWGEIGKNISDMLNKQVEDRDARREQINTATNDVINTLNDTDILGQDQNANAWWQNNAGQLQEYLLLQNRLWKNGQLDNVTYKTNIENTKNNTNQLINIFNNYNKLNDARVEKAKNGQISGQGLFIYDNLSNYANLNNTKMYINPADGNMVLSQKVDKNGQIVADNNPNGIKTVGAIAAALSSEYNPFDLDKGLQTPVKNFGTMLITQLGGLEGYSNTNDIMSSVNDIRQSTYYKKAEDGIVNMIMNNPDNVSSIYDGVVNAGIDFKDLYTYDPNDPDKNKVLLKADNNGRFVADFSGEKGKAQKQKVEEAVRARLQTMLDREVKSSLDPLLSRIKQEEVDVAALNARTKAAEAARKGKKQEQSDNSTALYNSASIMDNIEKKDEAGNVVGIESVPVPLSEKVNELLAEGKGDPIKTYNTAFQTIKKNGKRYSGVQLQRLPDDSNGRWGIEIKVPSILWQVDEKDPNKIKQGTITLYEPIDGASRMNNDRIISNIYNSIVKNTPVSVYAATEKGVSLSFPQDENTSKGYGATLGQ